MAFHPLFPVESKIKFESQMNLAIFPKKRNKAKNVSNFSLEPAEKYGILMV